MNTRQHRLLASLVAMMAMVEAYPAPGMGAEQVRLVVNVIIDQLRGDLLERYTDVYGEGGFKKLLGEGRVYSHAEYPFAGADRASSVACLMSGALPQHNGVAGERWIDRETLQPVTAADNAANLCVSTITDELKVGTKGRGLVYAVAPMRDAAVFTAGHCSDGLWTVDDNEEATARAVYALRNLALGIDHNPDFLSVTYSAAPQPGQDMMDVYIALNWQMEQLLEAAEGRNALFVVTGTGHADDDMTEDDLARYRIPTGEFNISRAQLLLNMYLIATHGQGEWVEACVGNQLYLNLKLIEKKGLSLSDVLEKCAVFLGQLSGVKDVRTSLKPSRGGDITITVSPGWHLVNESTRERTLQRDSYFSTPLFFYGADITPQRIDTPVTVDHVAPTLAAFLRIRAPNSCTAAPLVF